MQAIHITTNQVERYILKRKQAGASNGTVNRELLALRRSCKKAMLSGKVFHDLRRSGVRNLVRSGVSETVAMKISGHKTRSIFQRYNITNEEDLMQAAQRLDTHLKEIEDTRPTKSTGTNPGTISEVTGTISDSRAKG